MMKGKSVQKLFQRPGKEVSMRKWSYRVLILALIVVISILHYTGAAINPTIHSFYRLLYFIPIILAAFQFGFKGGVLTSLVVGLIYAPFDILWLGKVNLQAVNKILDIVLFFTVGIITGTLVEKQNIGLQKLDAELRRYVLLEAYTNSIIESIRSGVIAVNNDMLITTINQGAREILNVRHDCIGQNLTEVFICCESVREQINESIANNKPGQTLELALDNTNASKMNEDQMNEGITPVGKMTPGQTHDGTAPVAKTRPGQTHDGTASVAKMHSVPTQEGTAPVAKMHPVPTHDGNIAVAGTSTLTVRVSFFPLKVEGIQKGLVIIFEDITEVKKLQNQLLRSEKLAALGELSTGIAHEIRNPLGIIKAIEQTMRNELKDNPEAVQELEIIDEEIERANRVITSLMELGRPARKEKKLLSINSIIEDVLTIARKYITQHNVQVEYACSESIYLEADPEHLKQAFVNIIFNAVQAMPAGGKLRILTEIQRDEARYSKHKGAKGVAASGVVRIVFQDTGRGISPENLEKIFNPFYTTRDDGTGLGLAIVHRIVEEHGGVIHVESSVGVGSQFEILLPLGGETLS